MASQKKSTRVSRKPAVFDAALADVICERLSLGESLNVICSESGMPARATVYRWLEEQTAFAAQYARARERQAEFFLDLIVDETSAIDASTSVSVQAAKLRIDTLKWMIGKLLPRKYGERVAVGGAEELPAIKSEASVALEPGVAYLKMIGRV